MLIIILEDWELSDVRWLDTRFLVQFGRQEQPERAVLLIILGHPVQRVGSKEESPSNREASSARSDVEPEIAIPIEIAVVDRRIELRSV